MTATAPPITLLEAAPGHVDALATLHRGLFTPAWDSASFNSLMQQPGSLALLAVSGIEAHPVGFILGRVVADEAEILSLGVSTEWQRQGVAAQLVGRLAELAGERGASRIFLEVAADNHPARQLYLAQDFSEVGRRAGYYERQHGPRVDALIMALSMTKALQR